MVTAANFWPEFMRNEAGNLLCSYLAERGGGALGAFSGGAIGSYFGPVGAGRGARVGAAIGGAAGAALGAAWCPDGNPQGGEWPLSPEGPNFSGGQCPGVTYGVTVFYSLESNPGPFQSAGNFQGPISNIFLRSAPEQPIGIIANGVEGNIGNFSPFAPRPFEITDIVIVRNDGQPDNCGNPPGGEPIIPGVPDDIPRFRDDPFARRPIDVDVDFGGNIVNINGDIILDGPNINPSFGLEICFEFAGLRFCIDNNGNIRIGPGSGGEDGGGGGGGGGGDDDPKDDPLRVLSGVFYEVTNISNAQSRQQLSGNDLYFYPRFGAITFSGEGEKSQPIEMRSSTGFCQNPAPSLLREFSFAPYADGNAASFRELWDFVPAPPTPETPDAD